MRVDTMSHKLVLRYKLYWNLPPPPKCIVFVLGINRLRLCDSWAKIYILYHGSMCWVFYLDFFLHVLCGNVECLVGVKHLPVFRLSALNSDQFGEMGQVKIRFWTSPHLNLTPLCHFAEDVNVRVLRFILKTSV